ncbi:hypothetical protein QYF36_006982 [Acer negundo]|nr:hypothetical protein QYF36_006982 [Acer negundo]
MKKDPLGSRSFTDVVKGGQATTRIQEDIMRDGPIIMPWSIGQIHIYMKGKTYLVHMDVEPKPVSFRGMVNDSGGRSKSDLSNQHNHKKGRRIFEKVLDVLSSSPNKNKNQGVGEVGRGRAEVDKGKRLWVRHSKLKRLPIFYENAKLSIGNKKNARPSIPSQKTTSFSSSDQDRGCVLKTVHWKSGMLLKE